MRTLKYFSMLAISIIVVGIAILKIEWIKSAVLQFDSISSDNMLKGFLILCGILATIFFVNRVIDLFKKPKGKIDMNSIRQSELIGRRIKR